MQVGMHLENIPEATFCEGIPDQTFLEYLRCRVGAEVTI